MGINQVQLESILADMERLLERCNKRLLMVAEAKYELELLDDRTRTLLPEWSDYFRVYDRISNEKTSWWRDTATDYIDPSDCDNIVQHIKGLKAVLDMVAPEFLLETIRARNQFYFQGGEEFQARQWLFHLLERARDSICIIDPYLDVTVLDFVSALDPSIKIKLVSGNKKDLLVSQAGLLIGQGWALEGRRVSSLHDRFIIIDDIEFWHLGMSINGLGKKAGMIHKITDSKEQKDLKSDLEQWWKTGEAWGIYGSHS